MLSEGHKAVRVLIYGRVQGVFFRDWTVRNASSLGLDGWVRNRSDGTVEALFVGPDELVEKMIELAHNGPPSSKVSKVECIKAIGITPRGFTQKPSVNIRDSRN
jgi:acylphosphatase